MALVFKALILLGFNHSTLLMTGTLGKGADLTAPLPFLSLSENPSQAFIAPTWTLGILSLLLSVAGAVTVFPLAAASSGATNNGDFDWREASSSSKVLGCHLKVTPVYIGFSSSDLLYCPWDCTV